MDCILITQHMATHLLSVSSCPAGKSVSFWPCLSAHCAISKESISTPAWAWAPTSISSENGEASLQRRAIYELLTHLMCLFKTGCTITILSDDGHKQSMAAYAGNHCAASNSIE